MLHLIERKYGQKIVFIHTNKKKTLTKTYQNKFTLQDIILEISAPYTPKQNNHAEHQRHMLTSKVHTMHIAANLPQNLWPKTMKTTNYIINKTPTK